VKFDTLIDLLRNALRGVAVGWSEGLVGAERAAARRDPPIAVGAPQRGIDRELLHSTAHQPAKVGRVAIETAGIWRFRIQDYLLCDQLLRILVGWGGRPKGEPTSMWQNQRFCQFYFSNLLISKPKPKILNLEF
jgi:hypothetical protein